MSDTEDINPLDFNDCLNFDDLMDDEWIEYVDDYYWGDDDVDDGWEWPE